MGTLSYIIGLFSIAVLKVAIVNMVGGALYGYIIGYVAVYFTMDLLNLNCTNLDTPAACDSVKHTKCFWNSTTTKCGFTDADCYTHEFEESACKDESGCFWDYASKMCKHTAGMSSSQVSLFATAMTIGAVFGSFGAGPFAHKFGRRWALFCTGAVGLIASIILHIARSVDIYGLHVLGRLLIGVTDGTLCVVAPMYIFEMSPKEYLGPLSVYFQVFCTLGIFGASLVGIIIEPRNFSVKQTNEVRIQVLIVIQTILCALTMVIGFFMKESVAFTNRDATTSEEDSEKKGTGAVKHYSWMDMKMQLVVATLMAIANQLTGMNAIMNYAPIMTGALGLRPMLGNFIIMLWNFVTTFASIPVSAKVSFRAMYIGGIFCGIVALLIVAIPITPGVASDETRKGVAFFGIMLFILCFEVGIGPPFFLLAQQLFPKDFRPKGTSYTLGCVFIFNIIINACFPIAVTNISGGPSGNQNIGMCAAFYFFAFTGTSCGLILLKFLYPFPEEEETVAAAEEPKSVDL